MCYSLIIKGNEPLIKLLLLDDLNYHWGVWDAKALHHTAASSSKNTTIEYGIFSATSVVFRPIICTRIVGGRSSAPDPSGELSTLPRPSNRLGKNKPLPRPHSSAPRLSCHRRSTVPLNRVPLPPPMPPNNVKTKQQCHETTKPQNYDTTKQR